MVERNMTIISQKEYYKFRKWDGNIVWEYVLPKDTNATVDKVWNVFAQKTVPQIGVRKKLSL